MATPVISTCATTRIPETSSVCAGAGERRADHREQQHRERQHDARERLGQLHVVVDAQRVRVVSLGRHHLDLVRELAEREVHRVELARELVAELRVGARRHARDVLARELEPRRIEQPPDAAADVARRGRVGARDRQAVLAQVVDRQVHRVAALEVEARRLDHLRPDVVPHRGLLALGEPLVVVRLDLRLLELIRQRVGARHHLVAQQEEQRRDRQPRSRAPSAIARIAGMPHARMPVSSPSTASRLAISALPTISAIGTTREASSGMRAA